MPPDMLLQQNKDCWLEGFFGLAGYILSALRDLLRTRALRDCFELVNVNK